MKIPIHGIQAFVEIARLGSFQRAAEALCLTQAALSRCIQRLEEFVGVRLLDRTTRVSALTPVGREVLPLAERLVEDLTYGLERLRTMADLLLVDVAVATTQSVALRLLPLALHIYAHKHSRSDAGALRSVGDGGLA